MRAAPGWGPDEVWNGNQAAVDQHWQRHLLQLGYANTVLARIVARLRATGLYDRALLVVTADHGVSFRAGQKRRPLSPANLQDIAYVPLFVKLPHQTRGRVVLQPSRNTDILPTIAAALGVRIPWHVDGHSLIGSRPAERDVVLIKDHGKRFTIPQGRLEALRERPCDGNLPCSARTSRSRSSWRSAPTAVSSGRSCTAAGPSPTSTRSTVRGHSSRRAAVRKGDQSSSSRTVASSPSTRSSTAALGARAAGKALPRVLYRLRRWAPACRPR